MKIAILTPTYFPFSGIDRVVEQKAQEQNATVFTLDGKEGEGVVIMGMPKNLFWQRVYRLLFFLDIFKIIKYIRQLKEFDVIYSHLYPMNLLAWMAKIFYGKKYIYCNNGVAPAETFSTLSEKIYIVIFKWLNNFTGKPADKVISISHYLSEVFYKETGKKGEVEHLKVDIPRFQNAQPQQVRDKYKLGNDPLILYTGRISPHKGIDLLIKAFNKVLETKPQAKLVIVGKHTFNNYSQKLKSLVKKNVIFTGFVSDAELKNYYAACDLYATATLWEGFDLPVIESHYFDKPVVAFDIGPHKELIKEQDILVPARDVDALTEAILKKINEIR